MIFALFQQEIKTMLFSKKKNSIKETNEEKLVRSCFLQVLFANQTQIKINNRADL